MTKLIFELALSKSEDTGLPPPNDHQHPGGEATFNQHAATQTPSPSLTWHESGWDTEQSWQYCYSSLGYRPSSDPASKLLVAPSYASCRIRRWLGLDMLATLPDLSSLLVMKRLWIQPSATRMAMRKTLLALDSPHKQRTAKSGKIRDLHRSTALVPVISFPTPCPIIIPPRFYPQSMLSSLVSARQRSARTMDNKRGDDLG